MRAFKKGAWIIAYCPVTDKYLLGKRSSFNNFGKWDFFGGGMNIGESPEQAAIREFGEETNLTISSKDINYLVTLKLESRTIYLFKLILFPATKMSIDKNEHSKAKWFKLNKLPKKVNPPAKRIIEWLIYGKSY